MHRSSHQRESRVLLDRVGVYRFLFTKVSGLVDGVKEFYYGGRVSVFSSQFPPYPI